MTAFQSGRNFGFDTDMEMDYTEHSKKRGEAPAEKKICYSVPTTQLNFALRKRKRSTSALEKEKFYRSPFSFFSLLSSAQLNGIDSSAECLRLIARCSSLNWLRLCFSTSIPFPFCGWRRRNVLCESACRRRSGMTSQTHKEFDKETRTTIWWSELKQTSMTLLFFNNSFSHLHAIAFRFTISVARRAVNTLILMSYRSALHQAMQFSQFCETSDEKSFQETLQFVDADEH